MAETKPSGAVRPQSRIRQSATRSGVTSGVTHVKEYQPDRYTITGNHLAQHRELSLTAIGLGTHILSLPQGASADIRTLAERFTEGRDRIAFALRELEAHGYVERVRERVGGGRVITRTYAYNAPALTRARGVTGEREGAAAPVAAPADAVPAGPIVEEAMVEEGVQRTGSLVGELLPAVRLDRRSNPAPSTPSWRLRRRTSPPSRRNAASTMTRLSRCSWGCVGPTIGSRSRRRICAVSLRPSSPGSTTGPVGRRCTTP